MTIKTGINYIYVKKSELWFHVF